MIMALTTGVPIDHAQPLRHGPKAWMLDDLGLCDWLFDIDETSADGIADAVLQQEYPYDVAVERVKAVYNGVSEKQLRTMDVVEQML